MQIPRTTTYVKINNIFIIKIIFKDLIFTVASSDPSTTISLSSLTLPLISTFTLPQTIVFDVYAGYSQGVDLTITWNTINNPTSTATFPNSISDALKSPYNQGLNRFSIALSSLTTSFGVSTLKISGSSGSFKRCFISSYFCFIRSGAMYIVKQSEYFFFYLIFFNQ